MDRERTALYAGTIAAYADMYVTQSILPVLSKEFGVGAAKAGLTVSAAAIVIAAAAWPQRAASAMSAPFSSA